MPYPASALSLAVVSGDSICAVARALNFDLEAKNSLFVGVATKEGNMSSLVISLGNSISSAQVIGGDFRPSLLSETTPIVYVLDEDVSARESVELLIHSEGWRCETFASAKEFLPHPRAIVPNCLVLDASLRDLNALDLQKRVSADRPDTSIIFMANNVDVATTVKAIKAGAVEFLTKPFREDALVSSIREALEHSRASLAHQAEMRALRSRYSSLSRREREVMALVASGLLNKQVGGELGISEITVKAHRGQVMQKMHANSLADLVRMAARLSLASAARA